MSCAGIGYMFIIIGMISFVLNALSLYQTLYLKATIDHHHPKSRGQDHLCSLDFGIRLSFRQMEIPIPKNDRLSCLYTFP